MANQGYITDEECERWMEEPLPEVAHRNDDGAIAPYFAEWVRTILIDRYGSDDLYSRGFRVTTTLDLDMQRAAQIAMDSGWSRIENMPSFRGRKYADVMADSTRKRTSQTEYLQGMFIAIDPKTGEIRAMIGGRDFRDSEFNRAIQALRQPGSTFKPFTYTAAIQSGIPASHVIDDSPIMVPMHDSTIYSPRNYDDDFKGPLTLRDALRMSINTVTVKLGMEVGLETVAQTAKNMGLTTEVQPYPSTPIGSFAVYPLELVSAYTVYANTGTHVAPRPILKVEDADGRLLWETFPEREEVLDSAVAAIMRDMLSTAINNGSGAPARGPNKLPYEVPAAGKTGTTNDATDIWFVGFTPDLLAGVWFGFDLPRAILPTAAGGVYAAPVWGDFMRQMYYGETPEFALPQPWSWPSGITTRLVDRETGRLASSFCPEDRAYAEHFIAGTEPTDLCRPADGLFGGRVRRTILDTMTIDTLSSTIRPSFRRRNR
jgi:penicillin-binding protein 1A